MELKILGPLEVVDREGAAVRLPAGRARALLALLAIHRGEVVSMDRIVDALWGERPPETAAKAVQGYVSQLRRLLADGSTLAQEGVLVTRAPGYMLASGALTVDADRFERLAGEGRRALDDGSPAEAIVLLDDALASWRGPALGDFTFDDFARDEIQRLEDLRLGAREDRFDALLGLGRHGEVAGTLDSLAAAHPFRERLQGQLMIALYRMGRQADALQVYRDTRRRLADELGLDPGTELQRLERAVLAQDPALELPREIAPPRPEDAALGRTTAPPQRRSRRLWAASALLALLATGTVLALVLGRYGDTAPARLVGPGVAVIDPGRNMVVDAIKVGSGPVSIAADERGVWVGDGRDAAVVLIDPRTRRPVKTVGIGAPAVDVAASDGSVWVATGGLGTIVRVDADLGVVADRIEPRDPGESLVSSVPSVAAEGSAVWAGAGRGLVRIDPARGRVDAEVVLGAAPALQISIGGGDVWATSIENRAKRIDARSARVTADVYTGEFLYAVAAGAAAVWLGGAEGKLWRIDPESGATILTARVGIGLVTGIAPSGEDVWVTTAGDPTVVRLDAATGEVRAKVRVEGQPAEVGEPDVVVSHGLVWAVMPAPIV